MLVLTAYRGSGYPSVGVFGVLLYSQDERFAIEKSEPLWSRERGAKQGRAREHVKKTGKREERTRDGASGREKREENKQCRADGKNER